MTAKLVVLVLTAAMLAAGSGGAAPAPIAGTWRYGPATIAVTPAARPGTFVGKLQAPLGYTDASGNHCTLPAGFAFWTIAGAGTSYRGTVQAVGDDCKTPTRLHNATWTVEAAGLAYCSVAEAGKPPPYCQTLERVGGPAPATTAPSTTTPAPGGGIEDTWRTAIGVVRITRTGPGLYIGKVVTPSTATRCRERPGKQVWTLAGSGGTYRGTALVWDSRKAACSRLTALATWTVKGTRATLVTRSPNRITSTYTLERAG